MRFGGWDRVATFGCGMQLAMLPWEYEPPAPGMYTSLCTYEPALGSWATCVNEVVKGHSNAEGYDSLFSSSVDFVNLVCVKAGGGLAHFSVDEYRAALNNASHYLEDAHKGLLNSPIRLDERSRIRVIDAVRAEFLNLDNSNDSILWVYYYFALILLALIAFNLQSIRRSLMESTRVNSIRAAMCLPTVWGSTKHAQSSTWGLGGLLPTSFEASLLLGFFVAHTYALCSNYSVDYREVMEPVSYQVLQAIGNRSGILAFGLLPIMIVCSTRSNFIMRLTGLRYTTFVVLHRWLGRIIVVDSIIHSIAFYVHERLTGKLAQASAQFWWITGVWALVVSCVIVVQATGALRSRWYETFLYSHIILAILFFYFCWIHVKTFGWVNWIIWSVVFWIAERLYRVYLIFSNGGIIHADITPIGTDLLVLNFKKPRGWISHPTQYAFIYFVMPVVFWQSHPFTVSDTGDQLEVVILVKEGATRHLQAAALSRSQVPIAIEGPYGHTQSLQKFEKILLIGGGSGVPGPLALARIYPNTQLVIVTRSIDLLVAYQVEDLASNGADLEVYYTGEEDVSSSRLPLRDGRPDFGALISGLAVHRSAAVVCCGPPGLNDFVRNMTAATLGKNPGMTLEFLEEYQVW